MDRTKKDNQLSVVSIGMEGSKTVIRLLDPTNKAFYNVAINFADFARLAGIGVSVVNRGS